MSFWENIRQDLQKAAATVSEKTSELVKEGTEVVREGADIAAGRMTYTVKLAQLNLEGQKIEKSMDIEFSELGATLFKLYSENRLASLEEEVSPLFEKLDAKQQELNRIEDDKQELAKVYSIDTVEKENVKNLTKELENHGGTLKQIVLDKSSPIVDKSLKSVKLPKEALIGMIMRDNAVIYPDGETVCKAGDKLMLLGTLEDVDKAIESIAGN